MTIQFFNGVTLTLYELFLIFFTYGFLGWCSEVAFATLKTGGFVNRGFLNGPICPIYGFGMLIVVVCLTPLNDSWPLLFLGSMALTTALEFFTGWVLEKLFQTKWWDYSERKFNVKGYICLEFSILWHLCANRGSVVSSEALFEAVWGEKYMDSNNTVMTHIARLREKLHEPSRRPRFIKTVWGVGYTIE